MPTDLTGTPTSLGIGTYNVDVDAPSGLGFNEAMAQIDSLIGGRIATPTGIRTDDVPVWNGTAWVKPGGTPSSSVYLRGDGAWVNPEIGYDQITASVNITATTLGTAQSVIAGSTYAFDGNPVIAEFYTSQLYSPAVAAGFIEVVLFNEDAGSAAIADIALVQAPTAAQLAVPVCGKLRFTPSAGNHHYSIRALVSSATGGPAVGAGTGVSGVAAPAYLRFTRAGA